MGYELDKLKEEQSVIKKQLIADFESVYKYRKNFSKTWVAYVKDLKDGILMSLPNEDGWPTIIRKEQRWRTMRGQHEILQYQYNKNLEYIKSLEYAENGINPFTADLSKQNSTETTNSVSTLTPQNVLIGLGLGYVAFRIIKKVMS